MIVDIIVNRNFCVDIQFNGQLFSESVTFQERIFLYENALKRVDDYVDKVAKLSENEDLGIYLWCLTYDVHRDDGLRHTILFYFLIEQLKYLSNKNEIEKVRVIAPLPPFFSKIIKDDLGLLVDVDWFKITYFKIKLRYLIGPIFRLVSRYVENIIKTKKDKVSLQSNVALILGYSHWNNQRFRGFDEYINYSYPVYFLNEEKNKIKKLGDQKVVNLNTYNIVNIFSVFPKVFRFNKYRLGFVKKYRDELGTFKYFIINQGFFQTHNVFLNELLYRKVLAIIKPEKIVVMSTFGDPQKRMPLFVASQMGIKSILFAARPFISKYRSEDRLIKADINKIHGANIGDEIYVLDTLSKRYLQDSGINNDKIKVFNQAKATIEEPDSVFNNGLLVLFADYYSNEYFIDLISSVPQAVLKKINLYYRTHPSTGGKLSKRQMDKFKAISSQLYCLDNLEWGKMKFEGVVAIASDSTAGLEAVKRGAGIAWLPFVTFDSIVLYPLMITLGRICKTKEEFIEFITEIFNSPTNVNQFCKVCFENWIAKVR